MTEDRLLQAIRDWVGDFNRTVEEIIPGLENARDLCDEWLSTLRRETAKKKEPPDKEPLEPN